MLSCRETTQLISDSMQRRLPLRQRLAVAVHLLMCRFCLRYRKQIRFMEKAVDRLVESEKEGSLPETTDPCLSAEARERIKESLRRVIHQ